MAKRQRTTECPFDRALREALLECEDLTGLIKVLCYLVADYDSCPAAEMYEWDDYDPEDAGKPVSFSSACNCSKTERDRKFELAYDGKTIPFDGSLVHPGTQEPFCFNDTGAGIVIRMPLLRLAIPVDFFRDHLEILGIVERTRSSESTQCIFDPNWY